MGSPILVGLSKSRRVKPGAAAQHYIVLYCIVLYCIVFAALREERSRNVRSFELQLFRFDLCVNLINALGNPLLTVQFSTSFRKERTCGKCARVRYQRREADIYPQMSHVCTDDDDDDDDRDGVESQHRPSP